MVAIGRYISHHQHLGLGARNLGTSDHQFGPRGQCCLDGSPGRNRQRECEWDECGHGQVDVQSDARIEHRLRASYFPDERPRERFQPRHFDFGAQHVGLGRCAARVPRVRRGHDVPRETDLFGDQGRRSASLLQHQEGIGSLHSHVQRCPVRVRAKPVEIRQR